MNLIDHFNAFQEASDGLSLSANARSLYFAILGEFNKSRYPSQLKLGNALLQHLSGIQSAHSFDAARNSLINAKFITHKKLRYELLTGKTEGENLGKSAETFGKDLLLPYQSNTVIKNKDKDKNTTTTDARATFDNNCNSKEVQEIWFKCEGEQIPGGVAIGLYGLEKLHGTEKVCQAILTASQANTLPRLSLNFVKAVLERQLKGGASDGKVEPETWERQRPAFLD